MKKVLIFTYYWPPAGGVSVQRILKLSSYLQRYGWLPVIITVKDGIYYAFDPELENRVPPEIRVIKTRSFEPLQFYRIASGNKGNVVANISAEPGKKRFSTRIFEYIRANFLIPDARKYWKPYALRAARKLLANEHFDAIITTGPPHSTHLIGLELIKSHPIPWLADFRDPWVDIFYNRFLPRTERSINRDRKLEYNVLTRASCITVVGAHMKQKLSVPGTRIEVLPNGFDINDYGSPPPRASDCFVIRYIGSYLESEHSVVFWNVLRQFSASTPCRIEFVGSIQPEALSSIKQHAGEVVWTQLPQVPHSEALKLMQSAHLLLLAIPEVPHNKEILTGKLFEYIGSGTEILSIGPADGDAAFVLTQCNRNPMCDYNDRAQMLSQLKTAAQRPSDFRYVVDASSEFSRQHQAKLLAAWLDDLSRESARK
ncbi:MAG: glycosyltransferase [Flavobacteriales bacterium]|nr:glycosyltransferase [Flavobacteriales bacterium]